MKQLFLILTFLATTASFAQGANSEYRLGDELTLRGRTGIAAVESGRAWLTCDGTNLILTADLTDSDIGNSATANNEKTWLTGDACEFFFQPAGREDYYEIHVTPNHKTLQLHLMSVKRLGKVPFESQLFESGFKSEAKVEKGRWTVRMEIPLKSLGDNVQVAGSLFAVCRYNYNKPSKEPELTSSTPLPKSFHSPSEWHKIK